VRSPLPRIGHALTAGYGLDVDSMTRVWAGTATINARADLADGRTMFVKAYTTGADLGYEQKAIDTAVGCAAAGVPALTPLPDRDGRPLHHGRTATVSVWPWLDATPPTVLTPPMAQTIGRRLAAMHHALDALNQQTLPVNPEHCRTTPAAQITARFERLTHLIARRRPADSVDLHNLDRIAQRLDDLRRLPALRAGLPPLRLARVHGDLVTPNLLFHGDELVAVVDWRPQHADRAREVGRIACDPHTVAHRDDWPHIALTLIGAYADAGGPLTGGDLTATVRLALLHAMTSVYPIEDKYLRPAAPRLQAGLDRYWADRTTMITRVLAGLTEIEDALTAIAAAPAHRPAGSSHASADQRNPIPSQ